MLEPRPPKKRPPVMTAGGGEQMILRAVARRQAGRDIIDCHKS